MIDSIVNKVFKILLKFYCLIYHILSVCLRLIPVKTKLLYIILTDFSFMGLEKFMHLIEIAVILEGTIILIVFFFWIFNGIKAIVLDFKNLHKQNIENFMQI